MKLLIVDDSLIVRNAIARCAEASRLREVLRAEDGEAAVALFAEHRPQLVTMDLTMPRLDGLGAIQAIKAIEPSTSILVISALNSHKPPSRRSAAAPAASSPNPSPKERSPRRSTT
jgi:two-component system chemotaxis response regulator CheY